MGGSSDFFSLTSADNRPDDDDIIFGGSGTQISRNNAKNADGSLSDTLAESSRHAEDADTIVGDNGNIVRIVGVNGQDVNSRPDLNPLAQNYLTYNYDIYAGGQKIVVRGVSLLDYTPGGPDFVPGDFYLPTGEIGEVLPDDMRKEFGLYARNDIGGHDEVHGETGDDTIYLGGGADIAFGDAEDDDIIGGWGADFISGGTGEDGVIGDDGRIFTSRNSATYGENLFGVQALLASDPDTRTSQGNVLNEFIYTPGQVQTETINIGGELKKSVDITPYLLVPLGEVSTSDPLTVQLDAPLFADDIIFGGLATTSCTAARVTTPSARRGAHRVLHRALWRRGQHRPARTAGHGSGGPGSHRLHPAVEPRQHPLLRRRHQPLELAQADRAAPG